MNGLLMSFFGVMLLTSLVWCYMYFLRLTFMSREAIDAQALATPEGITGLMPEKTSAVSNNLKNLCELPILFYVLCLFNLMQGGDDAWVNNLALAFLMFRCLHSVIHCSYNRVAHRFLVYVISSMALWGMLLATVCNALGQ